VAGNLQHRAAPNRPRPDDRQFSRIAVRQQRRERRRGRDGALSTHPDRVSAEFVAGSLETGRVPWIRFAVTCGEAEAPLITTRKITRDDLQRRDGDYLYVVE